MDNNNISPLEAGMKSASQNKKSNAVDVINDKVKTTHSEDILAKVASLLFWVSTIGYGSAVITGFVMLIQNSLNTEYSNEKNGIIGLITIIVSVIFYLINLITWAKLKVTVNISRNLFVIKGLMLEDKEKKFSKEESSDTE